MLYFCLLFLRFPNSGKHFDSEYKMNKVKEGQVEVSKTEQHILLFFLDKSKNGKVVDSETMPLIFSHSPWIISTFLSIFHYTSFNSSWTVLAISFIDLSHILQFSVDFKHIFHFPYFSANFRSIFRSVSFNSSSISIVFFGFSIYFSVLVM